jgi:hypothetical protein
MVLDQVMHLDEHGHVNGPVYDAEHERLPPLLLRNTLRLLITGASDLSLEFDFQLRRIWIIPFLSGFRKNKPASVAEAVSLPVPAF